LELIHTAGDAKRLAHRAQPFLVSPVTFDGTLDELAERYIVPNMPAIADVVAFHRSLADYVRDGDALFLLRMVSGTERRKDYAIEPGLIFRATDNAPAWWTYAALMQGFRVASGAMRAVVETMPCHMFDIAKTAPPVASNSGWHIAHIFDVKDGNTDWMRWSRRDVIGRFVRNIHPANYFLLPKTDWQRWGGDKRVIGYFADMYQQRYAAIWNEFVELADVSGHSQIGTSGTLRYSYGGEVPLPSAKKTIAAEAIDANRAEAQDAGDVIEYRASRLTFKRDIIESLGEDQPFRVVTPVGTFQMTPAQLRATYPGVLKSVSYREGGTYNYATLPKSAERFRVK
jgi:hypothetical protein